jgi:hypothetical protein
VPPAPLPRALWELYVGVGLPALGSLLGGEWGEVAAFLRASIRDFHRRYAPASLLELWREAGIEDVHARVLSFGGGLVVWGVRSR